MAQVQVLIHPQTEVTTVEKEGDGGQRKETDPSWLGLKIRAILFFVSHRSINYGRVEVEKAT